MGEAIGQILPTAIGVAVSPLPIVAVVLMLVTPKGRVNGPAFVLGWIAGLVAVGTVVLLVADGAGAEDGGAPATWLSLVKLALGLLLLAVAAKQFRGRPREGAAPEPPKWMRALDGYTPAKAAATGALLSGANPKNLLLVVAGAASIAGAGLDGGDEAVVFGVFALIATAGVGTPVVLSAVLGDRARAMLDGLKDWLAANNAVIMAVLLLVLGAKVLGDAISGLSA